MKVLDFGLAKAFMGDGSDVNLSQSPTLSMAATQQGVILGTAAYMSPEQARGVTVDKRADIWAFGCVLYEMLTGRQFFKGELMSDVMASVLKSDPDYKGLPPTIHPQLRVRSRITSQNWRPDLRHIRLRPIEQTGGIACYFEDLRLRSGRRWREDGMPKCEVILERALRAVLRRCLEKEPKQRWHDVGDVRVELEQVVSDPSGTLIQTEAQIQPEARLRSALPFGVGIFVVTAMITAVRPSEAK